MFTTPCFIRKNTPEIRERLFELGYNSEAEDSRGSVDSDLDGDYLSVWTFYDMLIKDRELVEEPTDAFYTPIYERDIDDTTGIDCGTNEALFLAITALRDDSDYMQWFVSKGWKDGFGNVEDKWVLCDQDTLEYFGAVNNSPNTYNRKKYPEFGWHKATVKELIEHFKNKEN